MISGKLQVCCLVRDLLYVKDIFCFIFNNKNGCCTDTVQGYTRWYSMDNEPVLLAGDIDAQVFVQVLSLKLQATLKPCGP